jgi:hypothetical protein
VYGSAVVYSKLQPQPEHLVRVRGNDLGPEKFSGSSYIVVPGDAVVEEAVSSGRSLDLEASADAA